MTETTRESRTISTIRTGTKVAVIVGFCLIAVAAYFYLTPVYLLKPEGGVFECGSPSSPNTEAKNICHLPEAVSYSRALTALGTGLLVIVLGFALFGMGRVENRGGAKDAEGRRDRDRDADARDRDEDDHDRDADDRDGRDRDTGDRDAEDSDESPTVPESRSARHLSRSDEGGRSRRGRDRRGDDDWASDGWR